MFIFELFDSTLFRLSIPLSICEILSTFPFSFVKAKNALLLSLGVSPSSMTSSSFPSSATSLTVPSCMFWSGSRYTLVVMKPFEAYSPFSLFTSCFRSLMSSSLFSYSFTIPFSFFSLTRGFIPSFGLLSTILFMRNLGCPSSSCGCTSFPSSRSIILSFPFSRNSLSVFGSSFFSIFFSALTLLPAMIIIPSTRSRLFIFFITFSFTFLHIKTCPETGSLDYVFPSISEHELSS